MQALFAAAPLALAGAAPVATVDLDTADTAQLVLDLARRPAGPRPELVIDCAALRCQRTLGVSHVVSQLLVLHKAGAAVGLRNVNAPLRHCLELLKLSPLFRLSGK